MSLIKKLRRVIVVILKMSLFATLFFIFFGIFSINLPWLFGINRTSGITMLTFAILGLALMSIYGGYSIGIQKSKPIIYSLTLATIITDLVTHLQLSIMNTNERYNPTFVYETPELLLLVMVLQIIAIIIFVYLGNYIFFLIEPPENCCVIAVSEQSLSEAIPKIKKYSKQFKINNIISYDRPDIYEIMAKNDTIFLCDIPLAERLGLLDYCYQNNKNIYFSFGMADILSMGSKFTLLDDKPLVSYNVKDLSLDQRIVKRLMDVVICSLAVALTSPIMLLTAIAIKLDDRGKILYKQARFTKYGRIFKVMKFRTMKEDHSVNESVTDGDSRITRIGKFLRRYRIDELPQLFNILKGDMTIVGPRPEMVENVVKYTDALPEFTYRLRTKAGLTGLAQINGKYNTPPKDKLILDLLYIEKYSIWQDFKLIFQTITVLFNASESTAAFGNAEEFGFDEIEENSENADNNNIII